MLNEKTRPSALPSCPQPVNQRFPDVPPFGQSLHLDLYGVRRELCDDLSFCYQLLEVLTSYLGMHKQAPPILFRSPDDQFPDKAGLSGWVPLVESGISLRTLTEREFVTLDIYTCGTLDVEKTVHYLTEALGASDCECQHLIRGMRYYL
jgi:S-adenosylmethionine decarboxylase